MNRAGGRTPFAILTAIGVALVVGVAVWALMRDSGELYERYYRIAVWAFGLPPHDYIPDQMLELCELDAGRKVTAAADVAGYALLPRIDTISLDEVASGHAKSYQKFRGCFPCLKELVETGYQYIESYYISDENRRRLFDSKGAKNTGSSEKYHSVELYKIDTGLYRYRLIKRRSAADPMCEPFDEYVSRSSRPGKSVLFDEVFLRSFQTDYEKHRGVLNGKCLAVDRIQSISAPYIFETANRQVADVGWGLVEGSVLRYSEAVTERSSGKTIASSVAYRYRIKNGSGKYEWRGACGASRLPSIDRILQPKPN